MTTLPRSILLLSATSLLAAAAPLPAESAPPERDREAILAMAGQHEVLFSFEETVGYVDDYRLTDAYQEEATEVVYVTEDSGSRIALQHILQTGDGSVIKHWKQIWTWQDTRLVDYEGRDRWRIRELSPEEVRGTWTQLVTQVDDSPRYEGIGTWNHDYGVSLWESNRTDRPLPRREYTTRGDYDIVRGINRHAITPHGWVHEQDNLKLVLERDGEPAHYLAGETGVNYYDRAPDADFSAAREYWEHTEPFWTRVTEVWESILDSREGFSIAAKIDGEPLYERMFAMAGNLAENPDAEVPSTEIIQEAIAEYLGESLEDPVSLEVNSPNSSPVATAAP